MIKQDSENNSLCVYYEKLRISNDMLSTSPCSPGELKHSKVSIYIADSNYKNIIDEIFPFFLQSFVQFANWQFRPLHSEMGIKIKQ